MQEFGHLNLDLCQIVDLLLRRIGKLDPYVVVFNLLFIQDTLEDWQLENLSGSIILFLGQHIAIVASQLDAAGDYFP